MMIMSSIQITHENDRIFVESPYYPDFVAEARKLNGMWMKKDSAWKFDARDEPRVVEALKKVYGYGDTDLIDVEVIVTSSSDNPLFLLGREIACRTNRDAPVKLGRGVTVLEGSFKNNGGSIKCPRLINHDNVTLLLRDVPRSLVVESSTIKIPVEQLILDHVRIAWISVRGPTEEQRKELTSYYHEKYGIPIDDPSKLVIDIMNEPFEKHFININEIVNLARGYDDTIVVLSANTANDLLIHLN